MSKPQISVVVPTCHRNDLLALCLDYLAPEVQTLPASEYEVIVADDGSKSTAQRMVEENYPWARWVAGPRRGPAANRNVGAARTHGEFIAFTDDDCLPTPQWLAAYADAISEEFDVYEGATAATGSPRAPFIVAPVNLHGGSLWSCNMMVRRSLFDEIGGFDEGFPHAADEDVDLHQRIKDAGHAVQFVPDALIYHPLVRRMWGRKSARLWESKVRLSYKADPTRAPFTRREMVWHALRTRVRQLQRAPLHLDTLMGAGSLWAELLWIARHTRQWDRKHRSVAKSRENPDI